MLMEMNEYFSRLEALIAVWVEEIKLHTKTGSTDKNKYSEYIAAKLLDAAFSLNLEVLPKNSAAVDLGDKKAGIAFQITSRSAARTPSEGPNGPSRESLNCDSQLLNKSFTGVQAPRRGEPIKALQKSPLFDA